jgi:hypothetical protein
VRSRAAYWSRLALWWIEVHPPGEAFVLTTAPTTPQVEAILCCLCSWVEERKIRWGVNSPIHQSKGSWPVFLIFLTTL